MKNKLPNKVVVIKNADKDVGNWMEKWTSKRSPACIPHSFRLLALGKPGVGKTNVMKNIFLAHQATKKPFKKLYVITGSLGSNEWDDIEPTEIFDYIPELDLFDGDVKTCLIIDDFEFEKLPKEQLRSLTTLFRMISTHKNLSIMASYQSFFHVPTICRKTSNVFVLYKPTSDQENNLIANRVVIKPEIFKYLFKKFCLNYYDSIMVDLTKDSPYKIRKNIYEVIDYSSESDSDEEDS